VSAGPLTALVDFGSTFTKVKLVDAAGFPVASGQHRTTIETGVVDGLEAALADLAERTRLRPDRTLACSSAGGGLRMGVVGLVADLTAEAARQTALGAGARVLKVVSGGLDDGAAAGAMLAARPDIVLLAGGTDGGDRDSLVRSARALAAAGVEVPVVVAGNSEAQADAVAALRAGGATVFAAPNVMPGVDRICPDDARRLIRELFIEHVIGGKLGGSAETLKQLVKMATPDAALLGVEALATTWAESGVAGAAGVLAVDVGGATTDVHSWAPAIARPGYKREMLGQTAAGRTVEADLGMRWNAPGIIDAGLAEGLLDQADAERLRPAADRRAADPGLIPGDEVEAAIDRELARLAITVALRRHAGERRLSLTPEGAVLERRGRDLTEVGLLVGTGGVLAEMSTDELEACLAAAHLGREDRLLPTEVAVQIDAEATLSAAGLLDSHDHSAARNLLAGLIGQTRTKEDMDAARQR
jgi:uncharacterized protein (TIGR01319 family)